MTFLKNNRGFSLIEITVALGLAAVAGVAYMTHMQNVAKNEAGQKVRNSITQLGMQAEDYLKSRDVCNYNLAQAFKGVVLDSTEEQGNDTYRVLRNKEFTDANGNVDAKAIFNVGDIYEGGKVYVSAVNYKLTELTAVNIPDAPWNKSGKITVSVDFQTCRNNGLVYTKDAGNTLHEVCPASDRKTTSRNFTKLAAFKVDGANKIVETPVKEQKMVNGNLTWVDSGKKKYQSTCADSQDALLDASKDYTNKKFCLLDAKLMANAGREGTTSCQYNVKIINQQIEKTIGTGSFKLPLIENTLPGSLKYELIGGGGGGGGGKDNAGYGGKAGIFLSGQFEDSAYGADCNYNIGNGGQHGYKKDGGAKGGTTTLQCNSILTLSANGGNGGDGNGYSNGGDDEGQDGESSQYGPGSKGAQGNCYGTASIGAGGGGAGDDGTGQDGCDGGRGNLKVIYKTIELRDESGQLISMITGEPI